MRIGIIGEGGADIAVITNIIKGVTGLDSNDIVPLIPKLDFDNTDLAHLNPESFGNWSLVMKECIERKKIEEFLSLEDSTHIVIHIDTAEAYLYKIDIPPKNYHQYCIDIRNTVINKINELLENNYLEKLLYAVAVEEIDAWILVIYEDKESCKTLNPKKRLQYILKEENTTSNYPNFLRLSKPLSKKKEVKSGKFLEKNCSLKFFYEEVEAKLNSH